jgi:hypothetical protein
MACQRQCEHCDPGLECHTLYPMYFLVFLVVHVHRRSPAQVVLKMSKRARFGILNRSRPGGLIHDRRKGMICSLSLYST